MYVRKAFLHVLPVILTLAQVHRSEGQIDVRLSNGPSQYIGTIEYSEDGGMTWHTTCGNHLELSIVSVICRQLGFKGANRVIRDSPFNGGQDNATWYFSCGIGTQASLDDCTINTPCFPDTQPLGAAACYDDRYLGCFEDNINMTRVLPDNQLISNDMTVEKCIQYCKNNTQNVYAGVEDGDECYCGDASADYNRFGRIGDGGCLFPCAGDMYSSCGGDGGIAVFNLSVSLPPETTVRLSDGPSQYTGTIEYSDDGGMTWHTTCGNHLVLSVVMVICRQLGFKGANRVIRDSPFNGGQDNATSYFNCGTGTQASLDECTINTPCFPDTQTLGAAACYDDRYLGCFEDNINEIRVLRGNHLISNDMTIEKCIQYCKNITEYVYAGVEFGNECYCGDANADYDRFGPLGDDGCLFPCAGDRYSSCGGNGGIAVFKLTESQMISVTTSSYVTKTTPQNVEVAIAFGVLFGVSVIYGIFVSVWLYLTRRALLTLKKSQNSKEQDDKYQAMDRGADEKPSLYQDLKPTKEKELSSKGHTYESHIVVDEDLDPDNAYELNNF